MIEWIDSHGFIVLGAYMIVVFIAGTVPPLPAGASFVETWAYTLLKAIALNSHSVGSAMGIKLPELQMPSSKRADAAASAGVIDPDKTMPPTMTGKDKP